jgi:putative membrane protein insertion efficiency factor
MTNTLHRWLVALVLLPVALYRRVVSPMKARPSCRYLPTCSEYAVEAVKTRGVVVGSALAVGRVLRCNPLFHAGYHPVPHPLRGFPRSKDGSRSALAGRSSSALGHKHHCGEQH